MAGFTTRYGFRGSKGVSMPPFDSFNLGSGVPDDPEAVRRNRLALAAEVRLDPAHLVFMGQVHGTEIAEVTGPISGPIPGADGMVSAARGLGLVVLVADCVPILASDRAAGVIGVAHAGRIGASAGVVPALIARMIGLGARVDRVEVVVGPAICGRCYEVPDQMRDAVEASLPGSACTTSDGTAGLDLRAGVTRQLRESGVVDIQLDQRCTKEDPELFSHRRSAPTGRFAGFVRQ
jgi:YfiH family protein